MPWCYVGPPLRSSGIACLADANFSNVTLQWNGANGNSLANVVADTSNVGGTLTTLNPGDVITNINSHYGLSVIKLTTNNTYTIDLTGRLLRNGVGQPGRNVNFTMEMWINWHSSSNGTVAPLYMNLLLAGAQVIVCKNYGNTASFSSNANGEPGQAYSADTWHHVAVDVQGTTATYYFDGVSLGTASCGDGVSPQWRFGGGGTPGLLAYVGGFRLTTNVVRYSGNFTPPTLPFCPIPTAYVPANDTYFSSVKILCHFDGTPGSNTLTDVKGNTITAHGTYKLYSEEEAAGTTSGGNDATNGCYFSILTTAIGDLANSDFTVEFYCKPTTGGAGFERLFQTRDGDVYSGLAVYYSGASTMSVNLSSTGASFDLGTATFSMPLNDWYHVAIARQGTNVRTFLNGVLVATQAIGTASLYYNALDSWVFTGQSTAPYRTVSGYFDELRITTGVARYTAGFTLPILPFPNS